VVTSFLFRAHPVDHVYAGPVFWDFEHARKVMRAYRDFLRDAPEQLGAFVGLKTVPSVEGFPPEHQGRRTAAVVACSNGPADQGAEVIGRLLDVLPPPLFNWLGEMPYPAAQTMFDALMPKGCSGTGAVTSSTSSPTR
jgi:hypothetical protein